MKHLSDVDCYEKETAVFECQFNYDDAPVTWCKDDQASFLFIVGESCLPSSWGLCMRHWREGKGKDQGGKLGLGRPGTSFSTGWFYISWCFNSSQSYCVTCLHNSTKNFILRICVHLYTCE